MRPAQSTYMPPWTDPPRPPFPSTTTTSSARRRLPLRRRLLGRLLRSRPLAPLRAALLSVVRFVRFLRWRTRAMLARARYKQQLPFPWQSSSSSWRQPWTWAWLTWIALVSFTLNLLFVLWAVRHRRTLTPLDSFSPLHKLPLVSWDALRDYDPLNSHGNVVATSLYTDGFATAVATLGHSLNRVNSTARRLALYIPEQVSPRALCIASSSGFQPYPVQRIAPPDSGKGVYRRFLDQYTKLRLWELDEAGAHGVVYLDADTLVVRNFDELFALPYAFAAAPDVYTDHRGFVLQVNAGVLFLRPSRALFRDMVEQIVSARYARHEAEQAFLNAYFAKDVVRLPYAYNANLAIKARSRAVWAGLWDEMRVIHYTLVKPFARDDKDYSFIPMHELEANARLRAKESGGLFEREMEVWVQAWRETFAAHGRALEDCMILSDTPGHH